MSLLYHRIASYLLSYTPLATCLLLSPGGNYPHCLFSSLLPSSLLIIHPIGDLPLLVTCSTDGDGWCTDDNFDSYLERYKKSMFLAEEEDDEDMGAVAENYTPTKKVDPAEKLDDDIKKQIDPAEKAAILEKAAMVENKAEIASDKMQELKEEKKAVSESSQTAEDMSAQLKSLAGELKALSDEKDAPVKALPPPAKMGPGTGIHCLLHSFPIYSVVCMLNSAFAAIFIKGIP